MTISPTSFVQDCGWEAEFSFCLEKEGHRKDSDAHYRDNPKRYTKVDNYIFDIGKDIIIQIQGMLIDRMHKWRPKKYSFVYVLIRLASLVCCTKYITNVA